MGKRQLQQGSEVRQTIPAVANNLRREKMKGLAFSEEMMRAWLDGRKSITRRLLNPQPDKVEAGVAFCEGRAISPKYKPGESIYIKETWCPGPVLGAGSEKWCGSAVLYKATDTEISASWRSPRFMPEWASRSKALIVSVRPERVQSITPEEVKREGFVVRDFAGIGVLALLGLTPETYMESVAMQEFQSLWETLHPGSREKNDWVWRIELEKI